MEATVSSSPSDVRQISDYAPLQKGDKHIWGIYILLCIVSIIELYSASSREVAASSIGVYGPIVRHMSMLGAGFIIINILQRIHYKYFFQWTIPFVFISVVMMLYVMWFGEIVNGARRSFTLLGVTIQPSEFIKFSSVLIIAFIASRSQLKGGGISNRGVNWIAGLVLFFGGLLFKQGLTNTLLLMAISLSMMLVAGIQWRKFLIVLAIYGVIGGGAWITSKIIKERQEARTEAAATDEVNRTKIHESRLDAWNPFRPKYNDEIKGSNRQEMYAYMAQANGGIFGVFPGNSRETARLPLAFSDYIYSIIIEDIGLIGGLCVLVLYLWLLTRASSIAARCSRAFPAILVLGMAVMIVFQALFHIAIVTGVFPVSGQPLPLISKGGTSILITSIAFGVMLSVSRFAVRNGKRQDIRNEIEALPEEVRAENPTKL